MKPNVLSSDWESGRREFIETAETPGVVEAGINPLVKAINKHPCFVTISSCEGHEEKGEEYTHAYVNFQVRKGCEAKLVELRRLIEPVRFKDVYEKEQLWKPWLCPGASKYVSIVIPNSVRKKVIPQLTREIEKLNRGSDRR